MKAKLVVLFCFIVAVGYTQNRYTGLPSWSKRLAGNEFDGNIRLAEVTNRSVTLMPFPTDELKWMDDGTIKRIPKKTKKTNTQKIATITFNYFEEDESFNFYIDLNQYLSTEFKRNIKIKWVFDDGSKNVYNGNSNYYVSNKFFFNELYNDDEELCFYEILKKIANSNGFSVRIGGKNKNLDLRFSSNNSKSVFNFVIGDDANKDDLLENCSYYDRLKAKTQKELFAVNENKTTQSQLSLKTKRIPKKTLK